MLNNQYTLVDRNTHRVIAAGSWDAVHAAARLLIGTDRLVNRFERQIFDILEQHIREEINAEVLQALQEEGRT